METDQITKIDNQNHSQSIKAHKTQPQMAATKLITATTFLLLTTSIAASILPLLNPRPQTLLDDLWPTAIPDPFRILEEIPVSRLDDAVLASPARVDWKETPEGHVIAVDVPGMKKEELKIEVEKDRVLRISGERKKEKEESGDHWHRVERSSGKFWRSFKLPENVDVDSLSARLEDGVLTVQMKKLAPGKIEGPRVVGIEGGDSTPKIESSGTGKDKKQEL